MIEAKRLSELQVSFAVEAELTGATVNGEFEIEGQRYTVRHDPKRMELDRFLVSHVGIVTPGVRYEEVPMVVEKTNCELQFDEVAAMEHILSSHDKRTILIQQGSLTREGFEGRGYGNGLMNANETMMDASLRMGRVKFPDAEIAIAQIVDYSRRRTREDEYTGWGSDWARRLEYEFIGLDKNGRPIWQKRYELQ